MTPTQTQRVLRALHDHDDGITQVDFLRPDVIDGGYPITRLAARIQELRDRGADVFVDGKRDGCTIYRLYDTPEFPPPVVVVPQDETAQPALFDVPPVRCSPYEDAA
jgi:hypothetical protein